MKQFAFRLQKVMETTKAREQQKQRELAKALVVLAQNESLLETMLDRLAEQIEEYNQRKLRTSMTASDLMNFSHYTEKLLVDIQHQKKTIEDLAEKVRHHREKLIEVTRDKKILERLKEKRYEEYRKKLRKMEQKFNDELSVQTYQNGKKEDIH